MRFCPFCSTENVETATNCRSCARKLPLFKRRRRSSGDDSSDKTEKWADPDSSEDSLESVVPGPAGLKRKPDPPGHRRSNDPARRTTDVVVEGQSTSSEPSRATPPLPSRRSRDKRAAHEASRSIPLTSPADRRRKPSTVPPPIPPPRKKTPAPANINDWGSAPAVKDLEVVEDVSELSEIDAGPTKVDTPAAPEPAAPEAEAPESDPVAEPPERLPRARERDDSSWGGGDHAPPPTALQPLRGDDSKLTNSRVEPIPKTPERGLFKAVAYTWSFFRARRQRDVVIRRLDLEIERQTTDLDTVLGSLGEQVRALKIDNRVVSAENQAIDKAEKRLADAHDMAGELEQRSGDENVKFAELEAEREKKVDEAEARLVEAQAKKENYEGKQRSLRDKRKEIERRQKGFTKAADDRARQAQKADTNQNRSAMQRSSEDLRRQAKALDPERQDVDRKLSTLDKPLSKSLARVEDCKAELEAARHSLNDARAGHRRRMTEIDAEHGKRGRELGDAQAEIVRRMVTLGTLVNLHRVDSPEFVDLYARIDVLRNAISARTSEIAYLNAEREDFDRGALIRGFVVVGCAVLGVLALIALWLALK